MSVEIDAVFPKDLDRETEVLLKGLGDRVVKTVLRLEGKKERDFEVSLLYTDDSFISDLNGQYRGVFEPTDVLSFPMMDEDEIEGETIAGLPNILGDIVISLDTAQKQAEKAKKGLEEELCLLLAHGMLHLLGYDHGTEAQKDAMWAKQEMAVREALKGKGI